MQHALELLFGMPDSATAGEAVALRLMAWALLWLGLSLLGLYRRRDDAGRAFWGMSGLWALIDGVIALVGLLSPSTETAALVRILWINAGLDVGYVAVGVWLALRRRAPVRAAGRAIIIQGGFLLVFDGLHGWLLGA